MSFKDRIREARLNKHLTQEQLSKKIGVAKSTLAGYEGGNREPSMLTVSKIMDVLEVDANYLWQDEMGNNFPEKVSYEELTLIEKYRDLDDYGRKTIDLVLERELDRYKQFKRLQHKTANLTVIEGDDEPAEDYGENVVMMPTFMQKLCAGTGSIGDDVQLENEAYPAIRVPAGAQYAATVAGDSMEPEYSDGDVVFFNDTNTPRFGDIVVLSINKENYLKKYTERGFEALNPKYDILVPGESDFVVVLGKVLGKL